MAPDGSDDPDDREPSAHCATLPEPQEQPTVSPESVAANVSEPVPSAAHESQPIPAVPGAESSTAEPSGSRVEPVIEVSGLGVDFRGPRSGWLRRREPVPAIDDISFSIAPGEAVGFVGPPGIGKTTLVELLAGDRVPTRGSVRICGLLPGPGSSTVEFAARTGVMFGARPQLWPDLTLAESLRMLASMHQVPERQWVTRRIELVDGLGLATFLDRPFGQLSPDQRVRGEIAAAVLHEPDVVVLDEPLTGLDVRGKERVRSFLRQEHRVHGRTMLITSSRIGDVDQFCDRLLILGEGGLVYDGDRLGLINRANAQQVLVVDLNESNLLLDDVPGTQLFSVEAGGLRQRLSLAPGNLSTARVLADVMSRAPIRDLTLVEPPIEDVVRRLA